MTAVESPKLVPRRSCEGCTICCTLVEVTELNKPRYQNCIHCVTGKGCQIWGQPQRPPVCGEFFCGYMTGFSIAEHWNPSKCRMVLVYQEEANRIVVHVDKSRFNAWRQNPFHADLRAWSRNGAARGVQVIVYQGDDMFAILPDRDKPLGKKKDGQTIVFGKSDTPNGPVYDIHAYDDDDPELMQLRRRAGQTV